MATSVVRNDKKRAYHGYGPDGYKPGPFHGRLSDKDYRQMAREDYEKRAK